MGVGKGGAKTTQSNHHVFVVSHLFSAGPIHVCEYWCICLENRDGVRRDYNSYQTGSGVFLVKARAVCAASRCLEFELYMDHRFHRLLLSFQFPVNYLP